MWRILLVILAGFLPTVLSGQVIGAMISSEPPLSPAEITQWETKLQTNPADKETRLQLLRQYSRFAPSQPGVRSPFQAVRLNHILYLVENLPSDSASSSPLTYVPSDTGPFADAADHAAVRNAWNRAVNEHPSDSSVLLNAARFLYQEHPQDAEELLTRMVNQEPTNRSIAANLGFLYAMDILGITSPVGHSRLRPLSEQSALREHARSELDRTSNVFVLMGAGSALPNLFPTTEQARNPNGDQTVFELAASFVRRAREISPQEPEFIGPMPLIQEFKKFQITAMQSPSRTAFPAPQVLSPNAFQVASIEQASKLLEKPEAIYPPQAAEARIQGVVRFDVVIGVDGSVENIALFSGHPTLVAAAMDAVPRYRYQPTLLNGKPVRVKTQVEVRFTLSN